MTERAFDLDGNGSWVTGDGDPLFGYRPFPTETLPQVAATFVEQSATAIGCDPAFVALPLLSAMGAAVGNSMRLIVKRDWYAPPCIWSAVIAESGTQKSPAFRGATGPIRRLQKERMETYDAQYREYKAEKESYKAELKAWKKCKMGDPPEEPEEPTPDRLYAVDTTVEALGPILQTNPRGLLVAPNELSGWFRSMNKYNGSKGADEAHYLSMFDGDHLIVDRKTNGLRPVHVPNALVAITGNIQPAIIASSLSDDHLESGLASRFLFAQPPRRALTWTDAEVSESAVAAINRTFDSLLAIELRGSDDGLGASYVGMTEDAKAAFVDHYNVHHQEQDKLIGHEASAWSKLIGYVPRLALLHHCVTRHGEDVKSPVGEPSMVAAIRLAKWFTHEAERFYAVVREDSQTRDIRQMIEWIRRSRDGRATVREASRCGPSPLRGSAELILGAAVKAGFGRWDTSDRKKRVFECTYACDSDTFA